MKKKELKELSDTELEGKLSDLDKEIFALKNELKVNRKLEKPHLLKEKKKMKARILTKLNEVKA